MSQDVLARKYRPSKFAEVVGQNHVLQSIKTILEKNISHQAYIFSGTRGVGKTTLARLIAKSLHCQERNDSFEACGKCDACKSMHNNSHIEFIEVDAASNTQVDKIRELLESSMYKPSSSKYKIYLIDEVHMLSKGSFNALLKTLEEPPEHIVFLMATTEIEKVPKTILSRCLQFHLRTVSSDELIKLLEKVLKAEKIKFDTAAIEQISIAANGSVRDALTLADQCIAFCDGKLSGDQINDLLGTIDESNIFELLENVFMGNGEAAYNSLTRLFEDQVDYENILQAILRLLHKIILQKELSNSDNSQVATLANNIQKDVGQLFYEITLDGLSKFSIHPNPRQAVEFAVMRMLTFSSLNKNGEIETEKKNFDGLAIKETTIDNNQKYSSADEKKQPQKEKINHLITRDEWNKTYFELELSGIIQQMFASFELKSFCKNSVVFIKDANVEAPTKNIQGKFIEVIQKKFAISPELFFEDGQPDFSPQEWKNENLRIQQNKNLSDFKKTKIISEYLDAFSATVDINSISKNK